MKTIKLLSLEMQNFKGCKHQDSNFGEFGSTIRGRNGSGKTRHFDAFYWCLFGKDSQERKDYELKSRNKEGEQLQKVETSVSVKLKVNDETMTLKRAFVEDWVKPRGQKEQVLKKHHTECFINDVPMSVGEYTKRVTEIIDDRLLKMLTNPLYFAGMDWKKQREMLFNIAGTVTNEQIATGNDDYKKLLDAISGKSIEDYRKEIAMRKTKAKAELSEIQPRIDQTYVLMPKQQDWALIENQIKDCDESLELLDSQINDDDVLMAELLADNAKKRAKIEELRAEKRRVVAEANSKLKDEARAEFAAYRQLSEALMKYEQASRTAQYDIDEKKRHIASNDKTKDELLKNIQELRDAWYAKYKETIPADSNICPHCGQQLPEEQIENIKQRFEDNKNRILDDLTSKGKKFNAELENIIKGTEELHQDICRLSEVKKKADELVEKTRIQMQTNRKEHKELTEFEISECKKIDMQIAEIESTIQQPTKNIKADEAKIQKRNVKEHRDALVNILNDRQRCEEMKKQIAELEERGRLLAGEIAAIEQKEDTISEFNKAKIRECNSRVNSMFDIVKWKLFDYTLEGGEFEVCVPMVDGVPFPSANTAGKIQAGLDIIKVLQRFFNTQAVIFIDNRESVQEIPEMNNTQIINLIVDDCEITINNL